MLRKWTILASVVTAVTLAVTGLSMGADEDSPLHKVMEKVNAKNNAIKKATRTPAAYKKAQKELAGYADELIDLGKQSREMKSAAEKEKKPVAEWEKLSDDFIAKTQEYKGIVAKSSTTQDQAKKAYSPVALSCTNCHTVFRKEDD
jgi:cytochrome c556